jgi:hypothetical protein
MLRVLIAGVALAASAGSQAYVETAIGDRFDTQSERQKGYVSTWESSWNSDHKSKDDWQFNENSFNDALAEIAHREDDSLSNLETSNPGDIDWQTRRDQWLDRLSDRIPQHKYDWLQKVSSERREALRERWRNRSGDDGGISTIPLPASVWLLLSGLGALLGWSKRQKMKAIS